MAVLQQINKAQLRAGIIDSTKIDLTTVGKSLITKLVLGDNSGLVISNSTGVDSGTGEVTLSLDNSLSALANLTGTGFLSRSGDGSIISRSLEVSSNLTISNANGVSNNPTLDLANTGVVAGTYKYVTTDAKGRITAGYRYLDLWVANEICPNPSTDLTNYTVLNVPVTGTMMVFVSGAKQIPGADKDYTFNSTTKTITFTTINLDIDIVTVCYFWNESGINNQDIQHETLVPFDGTFMRYRLGFSPAADSQVVFLNGLLQRVGGSYDYSMDGQDVVFNYANDTTDLISVLYFR